ncbi:MAG: hypothetical protein K9M08_05270 [Pirellula sp.]|nr:hypothetical protein [Pirellula sp.]
MDSYSEVRRVRMSMSADAGHDIRKLAAKYNELRASVASRIVDPGTKAEQCDAPKPPVAGLPDGAVITSAG